MDIRTSNYNIDGYASKCVASALCKVFTGNVNLIDESTHEVKNSDKGTKYKVKVTNKRGETYVRYLTREKISELRSNTDIKTVELTDDGVPISKDKPHPGFDKIGKEDGDIDNDGDKDESDQYLQKKREAIAKTKAMNESKKIVSKNLDTVGNSEKEIDISTKKNSIKLNPSLPANDKYGMGESVVTISHESNAQKILKNCLQESSKKKETSSIEKAIDKIEDDTEEAKEDPRGNYARINTLKNKIRSALGIKNPIIMSAEETGEENISEGIPAALAVGAGVAGAAMAGAAAIKNRMQNNRAKVTGTAKPAQSGTSPTATPTLSDRVKARNDQLKSLMQSAELEGDSLKEARRSEKEGKGSPESPNNELYNREQRKERGKKGYRHSAFGGIRGGKSVPGSKLDNEKYLGDNQVSQKRRLGQVTPPGKYLTKLRKKRDPDYDYKNRGFKGTYV